MGKICGEQLPQGVTVRVVWRPAPCIILSYITEKDSNFRGLLFLIFYLSFFFLSGSKMPVACYNFLCG